MQEREHTDKRHAAWKAALEVLRPHFDGRAVAMGDCCVAAVHYADCFDGMEDFSFGMIRSDYERLLPAIADAARRDGLLVEDSIDVDGAICPRPFARFAIAPIESSETPAWLSLYPLDEIPLQTILRFRLFKQASEAMGLFFEMETSGDYSRYPEFQRAIAELRRFEGSGTGLYASLCVRLSGKRMGERTVFQRTIIRDDLFPIREIPFGDSAIPVARKVSNWTLEMTEQRQKAIAIIQKESLESLREVDRACEKLDLDYFLVGGSMLGALRHGGFIPWDDDTDIGMLRGDYVKFCKGANSATSEGYFLQLPSTDPHIHFVYARLRKPGTEYITHYNEDKDFHKGIWVDVFPFDARPKSEALARIQRVAANTFARASMGFKRRREYIQADMKTNVDLLPESDRAYLKRYALAARFFPVGLCRLAYHASARFFNPFLAGKPGSLYASFIPSYTTIAQEEVRPLRRVRYETAELSIPYGAEAFLTRQYGDYGIIPQKHERYAEHGFKYLKTADGEIIEA